MNRKTNVHTSTVIGSGMKLEAARLTGQGTVKIDGDYVGDVELNTLEIGENGRVTGDIWAKNVKISGWVLGNICGGETVHITSTAHVEGCIETQTLITDEGSWFNGKCQMINMRAQELQLPALPGDTPENFDNKVERFISVLQSQPVEHMQK